MTMWQLTEMLKKIYRNDTSASLKATWKLNCIIFDWRKNSTSNSTCLEGRKRLDCSKINHPVFKLMLIIHLCEWPFHSYLSQIHWFWKWNSTTQYSFQSHPIGSVNNQFFCCIIRPGKPMVLLSSHLPSDQFNRTPREIVLFCVDQAWEGSSLINRAWLKQIHNGLWGNDAWGYKGTGIPTHFNKQKSRLGRQLVSIKHYCLLSNSQGAALKCFVFFGCKR